ncbi:MAG: bifunctional 4-hydroxy-3-methylbut-2-enyl diphosphate reductase/30S ribosomal protein S1 [Firmicutes bacterium]|nr:bifunctional 4-hydroxy-3-methylbut-2-enyl diphosphate reductase/30S ribosomal protein S1 [Bacillota bacterium]
MGLKITLAESAGYCPGVAKAVNLALETASQSEGKVHSLGPIIHNPQAVEYLRSKGVEVAEELEDLESGSRLLIRSHGLPPKKIESAREMGLEIVDATCVFVKRAQKYAEVLYQEGYKVCVIGDYNHPEVIALVAHTNDTAVVIRGPDDIDSLELSRTDKVGVIAQTTQQMANFVACITKLLSRVAEVRAFSTICPASTERQAEARKLAQQNEVVLVVGGKNSANTTNLANIARAEGARTYHIESADEIRPEWFRGINTVGITAGASTPSWIIEGVIARMEEMKDLQTSTASEEVEEQATPAPDAEPTESAPETMSEAALDKATSKLEKGATVKATVVQVEPERVLVDVGYKTEGIIELRDLSRFKVDDAREVVSVGDIFNVIVIKPENEDGHPILSKKRADAQEAWEQIMRAKEGDGIITATVKEEVKGGLLVDLGVRAFVPASQVSVKYVEDLSQYIGKELQFKIIEVDEKRRNVVLSHKEIEEEQQEAAREEVFTTLKEGDVITGTVKRLTDFGAFVEIKPGVEGLLHVSEIAWERVKHPRDVLTEGEQIQVKVLGVDKEKGRISLGRKQVLPDPWTTLAQKVSEGDIIKGTVTRTVDFGAFVKIEPGVEGLVHISELAYHHVATPEEVVKPGDEVDVKVLSIDPEARRVSLSIKQTQPQPKKEASKPKQEEPIQEEPEREGYTIGDVVGNILGSAFKDKTE